MFTLGLSSGSDVQLKANTRHHCKKVSSEDYDGDCESENPGKNRVKKTANRSRILKQKPTNSVMNEERSNSTPIAPAFERMEVDADMLGLDGLVTPLPVSPIPHHLLSTSAALTPEIAQKDEKHLTIIAPPKPLFETPADKPVKKFKRKRVTKHRQMQVMAPTL